ncbi:glycoside hydrolase family 127 protein [uncultured Chitinophaga sp.]|jgi:Uncharacterized protein conserved in bacteria|uniref:aceric acid hydrolase n=1 Tax=uncultured Chitinophaga sp. TaxID=339340 RepID=UPI002612DF2C|nr:glycoside hydrolase family 127 protein [uncultured Chitinophaga sp.]
MKQLLCRYWLLACLLVIPGAAMSQQKALVNTSRSTFASLSSIDMGDVQWTSGFWAERFSVCRDAMVPHLWKTYTDPDVSHAFKNFEIAAGLDTGAHAGPPFHDGDFYKLLEAVACVYAITKDKRLDALMDSVIPVIARCQRGDGYIHTPVIIAGHNKAAGVKEFEDRLNFETYNMGHLMTAACVHYRATGKTSLLKLAIKAADYLDHFYKTASPALARNTICPSHYMGVVELYRATNDTTYLQLAKNLINIRGYVEDGTDDNQDRIPFRRQTTAMGHAVRANYLYAGVADVYAETGEDSLMTCLQRIWEDVVYRKMYITGGCGALYDGVSPYGTSYEPQQIQKTHQAYGRAYQLPNMTAHNETCANIGNVLWNWRMLQISGDARYADVLELALYNSVLSGISLDGDRFFYTNPLSAAAQFPYQLRWSGGRTNYIRLSNCCPPNVVRTIAEAVNYAYGISDKGLWVHLYGGNTLSTHLKDGGALRMTQQTDYPWDGNITLTMQATPATPFTVFLRIPGWSKSAKVLVNGKPAGIDAVSGQYAALHRSWKAGDVISLQLPMPVTMMESNPLVEETRNQVAVKRGPLVYCLESADLPEGACLFDIVLPGQAKLQPVPMKIDNSKLLGLSGTVLLRKDTGWNNTLYREAAVNDTRPLKVTFIPYYAWGNRGLSDMEVWVPKYFQYFGAQIQ